MIDENNAYRITERLAFPRLIGSEGEEQAINLIVDEFEQAGYNSINREKFKTSFYNLIFARFIFLVLGSGLILLALSFYIHPILTITLVMGEAFLAFKSLKVSTSNKIKLLKNETYNYETENVSAHLKSKNSKWNVILIGHWDSKSQTFPTSTRILIFMVFTFGTLIIYLIFFILSILRIFINFYLPVLNNILLDVCIVIALIGVINYFNKTGNESFGAFDNAAAVATIIELARYYKLNPLSNIDLLFLITGSEELNLGGAVHFLQNNKDKLDRKSTYFINLDFIGGSELVRLISSYGIPRKHSSFKLNSLFLESAKELNINIKEIYASSGVWSDYMPIVQEGYEACWLGSEPGLKFVHTSKDDMDLISKEGIRNILLLCMDVLYKIENELV
ncbi:MAG: M28 family metallopeptidase [Promethearchaeota archaeon]